MKKALVLGAGGFIGSHLVSRLREEGYWVRGVDLKKPEFSETRAHDFILGDLRIQALCRELFNFEYYDEIYQLAADMGGAGYIFTGQHDADVMHNSAQINLNIARLAAAHQSGKIFYSSSACMYPEHNQRDPNHPRCGEDSAYPANPDSEYGWEKLFSERLYLAFARNHGLNVRVARLHNVFGPQGTWQGGREKAPAAICRKVAAAEPGDAVEVWGDGQQTRSFLYIDECIEAIRRLMSSEFTGPVNIGSEEKITIEDLVKTVISLSGKNLSIRSIDGPTGVRGRNSDNRLIREKLGWAPHFPLKKGLEKTYLWIEEQINARTHHSQPSPILDGRYFSSPAGSPSDSAGPFAGHRSQCRPVSSPDPQIHRDQQIFQSTLGGLES